MSSPPADLSARRYLIIALLLTILWAVELTISQQFSIPAEDGYRSKDLIGRFFLSFFLLFPLVLLLHRLALASMLVLSLFFQWGMMYYSSYFDAAPEIMVLLNNVGETVAVGDAVWATIPWNCLLFLLPVFALKMFLLFCLKQRPKEFGTRPFSLALYSILCFAILLTTLIVLAQKSPGRLSVGSRIAKVGFLPIFAQDILFRFTQVEKLKEQALQNELRRSFGLKEEYQDFAFRDIVVLQIEALDRAVIDYTVKDKPVTPFLNALQQNSLTYRLGANCRYGSATADFEMLTGIPPLDGFFNYKVPDLPYNTSLARFLKEQGYETFCFHGVSGSFYNRQSALSAMNFDHLMFREEIIESIHSGKHALPKEFSQETHEEHLAAHWLRDDIVLETALQEIQSPSEKNRFIFLITATSHSPFRTKHIRLADKLIPNELQKKDSYLNSMHVVDGWLHSFYEGLPTGTLLVIYGDHTAKLHSDQFASDMEGKQEFVPCFIHVVGSNLAGYQKIPSRQADSLLSVRDVHSFLRDAAQRNKNRQEALLNRTVL